LDVQIAKVLLDKVPRLARMAVSSADQRGVPARFSDELMARALVEHAKYLVGAAAVLRQLPPAQWREVLLLRRPYCSESPELFWPLCKLDEP
jgi:hypothetical protein